MPSDQPIERKRSLVLAALGVVYGDIGTSPLYALRECFHESRGLPVREDAILGILSLIIWSLIVVVTVKYILFVMSADNEGEGGVLALMALGQRYGYRKGQEPLGFLVGLGLFGAAFLYGDGLITPAISVLSAVEGLEVATPVFKPFVLLITVIVLLLLFLLQRRGAGRIGAWFGPVLLIWFSVLALLGLASIVRTPIVLSSIDPLAGVRLLITHPVQGFFVLGSVFLVLTGAEALYADMGQFGKRPIRIGWLAVVLPALLLHYLGQGALLMRDQAAVANPFFLLGPAWLLYPLVLLATAATIIASQAMITGVFSLTHQAAQLGYLPHLDIRHTSPEQIGQIYVPTLNWMMAIGTIGLVWGFGSSGNLAAAYGVAVSATMLITTLLLYRVARYVWQWSVPATSALLSLMISVDLAFFSANVVKLPAGGWLPVVFGILVFTLMTTWYRGRELVRAHLQAGSPGLQEFFERIAVGTPRMPGYAVFLTPNPSITPVALMLNVRHNKVLHQHAVFVTVVTEKVPRIPCEQSVTVTPINETCHQVTVRFGFMDTPDVPRVLFECGKHGLDVPLADTSFFLSRLTFLATPKPGMALWREKLFVFLSRNSQRASSYFRLPSDRVVEIGLVVEI